MCASLCCLVISACFLSISAYSLRASSRFLASRASSC
jgi:hypothetical protein